MTSNTPSDSDGSFSPQHEVDYFLCYAKSGKAYDVAKKAKEWFQNQGLSIWDRYSFDAHPTPSPPNGDLEKHKNCVNACRIFVSKAVLLFVDFEWLSSSDCLFDYDLAQLQNLTSSRPVIFPIFCEDLSCCNDENVNAIINGVKLNLPPIETWNQPSGVTDEDVFHHIHYKLGSILLKHLPCLPKLPEYADQESRRASRASSIMGLLSKDPLNPLPSGKWVGVILGTGRHKLGGEFHFGGTGRYPLDCLLRMRPRAGAATSAAEGDAFHGHGRDDVGLFMINGYRKGSSVSFDQTYSELQKNQQSPFTIHFEGLCRGTSISGRWTIRDDLVDEEASGYWALWPERPEQNLHWEHYVLYFKNKLSQSRPVSRPTSADFTSFGSPLRRILDGGGVSVDAKMTATASATRRPFAGSGINRRQTEELTTGKNAALTSGLTRAAKTNSVENLDAEAKRGKFVVDAKSTAQQELEAQQQLQQQQQLQARKEQEQQQIRQQQMQQLQIRRQKEREQKEQQEQHLLQQQMQQQQLQRQKELEVKEQQHQQQLQQQQLLQQQMQQQQLQQRKELEEKERQQHQLLQKEQQMLQQIEQKKLLLQQQQLEQQREQEKKEQELKEQQLQIQQQKEQDRQRQLKELQMQQQQHQRQHEQEQMEQQQQQQEQLQRQPGESFSCIRLPYMEHQQEQQQRPPVGPSFGVRLSFNTEQIVGSSVQSQKESKMNVDDISATVLTSEDIDKLSPSIDVEYAAAEEKRLRQSPKPEVEISSSSEASESSSSATTTTTTTSMILSKPPSPPAAHKATPTPPSTPPTKHVVSIDVVRKSSSPSLEVDVPTTPTTTPPPLTPPTTTRPVVNINVVHKSSSSSSLEVDCPTTPMPGERTIPIERERTPAQMRLIRERSPIVIVKEKSAMETSRSEAPLVIREETKSFMANKRDASPVDIVRVDEEEEEETKSSNKTGKTSSSSSLPRTPTPTKIITVVPLFDVATKTAAAAPAASAAAGADAAGVSTLSMSTDSTTTRPKTPTTPTSPVINIPVIFQETPVGSTTTMGEKEKKKRNKKRNKKGSKNTEEVVMMTTDSTTTTTTSTRDANVPIPVKREGGRRSSKNIDGVVEVPVIAEAANNVVNGVAASAADSKEIVIPVVQTTESSSAAKGRGGGAGAGAGAGGIAFVDNAPMMRGAMSWGLDRPNDDFFADMPVLHGMPAPPIMAGLQGPDVMTTRSHHTDSMNFTDAKDGSSGDLQAETQSSHVSQTNESVDPATGGSTTSTFYSSSHSTSSSSNNRLRWPFRGDPFADDPFFGSSHDGMGLMSPLSLSIPMMGESAFGGPIIQSPTSAISEETKGNSDSGPFVREIVD